MSARSEAGRAPRTFRTGPWMLVASIVVVAALVVAFALTRSETLKTTGTKPVGNPPAVVYQVPDAGPVTHASKLPQRGAGWNKITQACLERGLDCRF